MNLDWSATERFFSRLRLPDESLAKTETIICPSFPFLSGVKSLIKDRPISLGAQNLSPEPKGALTGEVSGRQLYDVGCRYVIVGHSERRELFHENDEIISRKISAALKHKLIPIVCFGENYEEKEAGLTKKVVEEKITNFFGQLPLFEMRRVVLAYEPVWAISTSSENAGQQADSPESAQVVHKYIRRIISRMFDQKMAAGLPIIYGGSVSPDNIGGFAAMDDIDGVLVGGASNEADNFQKIIEAYF